MPIRPVYFTGDLAPITVGMRDENRILAESAADRRANLADLARNRTQLELGRGQQALGAGQLGYQNRALEGELGYRNRALDEESAIRKALLAEQTKQFGETHSLRERELVGRLAEIDAERQARTEADYARMAQQERLYKMQLRAGNPEFNMLQYEQANADLALAQKAESIASVLNGLRDKHAIEIFDSAPYAGAKPHTGAFGIGGPGDRMYAHNELRPGVIPGDFMLNDILPQARSKAEEEYYTRSGGVVPEEMRMLRINPANGRWEVDPSRIRKIIRYDENGRPIEPTPSPSPTPTPAPGAPSAPGAGGTPATDARDRIAEDTVRWNNVENRPMNPEEIRASSPRSGGGSQYFPSNLNLGPITPPTIYGGGDSQYFDPTPAPTPAPTGGRLPPPPVTAAPESLVGSTGYVPGGGYFIPGTTGIRTPTLPTRRPVTGDQVRGSRIVPLTPGLPTTTLVGGPNGEVAGIPNNRRRNDDRQRDLPPISEVPPEFSSRPLEFIDTQSWDRDSDAFGMITPPFRNPFPFSNYNTPPAPNSVMRVPTVVSPDPTLAGNPRFPFRRQYSRPPTNQTMFPQETPPGVQVMRSPIVGTNVPSATNPFPFQPAPATNQVFMPHWSGRVKQYPGLPQWMYPPIDYRTVDPEEWIDRDRRQYVEPLPMLY